MVSGPKVGGKGKEKDQGLEIKETEAGQVLTREKKEGKREEERRRRKLKKKIKGWEK